MMDGWLNRWLRQRRSVPGSPLAWRCPRTCHVALWCCSPDAQCLCVAPRSHWEPASRSQSPWSKERRWLVGMHARAHTPTHFLTPEVKTAEFPPSNISSSSSSVVAFPAEKHEDHFSIITHILVHLWVYKTKTVTHWSLAVSGCVLYSSPWSPPGPHCTWSSLPQTSWTALHAGRTWNRQGHKL